MAFQVRGVNRRGQGAGYGTVWVHYPHCYSRERNLVLPWRRASGRDTSLSSPLVCGLHSCKVGGDWGHRGGEQGESGVRVRKFLEISTEIKERQICKAVTHRVKQLVNRKNVYFGRKLK